MSNLEPNAAAEAVSALQTMHLPSYIPCMVSTQLYTSWLTQCCSAAISVVIFYDHILTFPRELGLIWGRGINCVTVLYHLNKWGLFVWSILNILAAYLPLDTISSCFALNIVASAVNIVLFISWAAFSAICIFAVSGGSWWLGLAVFTLNLVPVGANAYGWYVSTVVQVATLPVTGPICVNTQNLSTAAIIKLGTRVCVIASDAIIIIVTWIKAYGVKRQADRHNIKTPLTTVLLRDGTGYFLVLLALNIVDVAGWATNVFVFTVTLFVTPLSSTIMSHFPLNLRQVAYGRDDDELDTQWPSQGRSQPSSIKFGSFVSNMGEPVGREFNSIDPDLYWLDEVAGEEEQGDHDARLRVDPNGARSSAVSRNGGLMTEVTDRVASRAEFV